MSGIALIVAFIWLKESHPLLVDEDGRKIRNKVEKVEKVEKRTSEGKFCVRDMKEIVYLSGYV